MILLPKYKTVYADGHMGRASVGLKGEVRCIRRNSMGQINYDSGWDGPNLIVNAGMDNYAKESWCDYVGIGSSNTTEAYTDTGLGAQLFSGSRGNGVLAVQSDINTSSPYEFWAIIGRRFAAGQGTGTVREVGLFGDFGSPMFARKVLAAPITKASDEVLDVFYKVTKYLQLTDTTGDVVTIDSLNYDVTTRIYGAGGLFTGLGGQSGVITGPEEAYAYSSSTSFDATDGGLSAITATAGGSGNRDDYDAGSYGSSAYVDTNYYRDHVWNCGLDGWNLGAGIRTVCWRTRLWYFQSQFVRQGGGGETIPKDNTRVMEGMTFRTSWTRHSGS